MQCNQHVRIQFRGQLKKALGQQFGTPRHTQNGWKGIEAKRLVRMNYFQEKPKIPMLYQTNAYVEYWNTITGQKLHLTRLGDLHGEFHTKRI